MAQKATLGQGRGGRPMEDAWAALLGAVDAGFTVTPRVDRVGPQRGTPVDWGKGSSHCPVGDAMRGWFRAIAIRSGPQGKDIRKTLNGISVQRRY
jgi:hypothetical protein